MSPRLRQLLSIGRRGLALVMQIALALLALAALLALLAVACIDPDDFSSSARPRITLAYAAFFFLDPLVWEAARNSLALSAVVTFIALSTALAASRFARARPPKTHQSGELLAFPMAFPPLFVALGIRALAPIAVAESGTFKMLALVAVELYWAIPLLWMSTRARCDRLGVWRDSAFAAGGPRGPARAWRAVVYPTLRSALWRDAAIVFLLTLAEPAAPIVLGIDRMVAPWMLQQIGLAGSPQGLALVSLALGVVAAATLAIALHHKSRAHQGDAFVPLNQRSLIAPARSRHRVSWPRVVIATACAVLASLPLVGLARSAFTRSSAPDWLAGFLASDSAFRVLEPVSQSLALAVAVATSALLIAFFASSSRSPTAHVESVPTPIPALLAGALVLSAAHAIGVLNPAYGASVLAAPPALAIITLIVVLLPSARVVLSPISSPNSAARADFARIAGAGRFAIWWANAGRVVSLRLVAYMLSVCGFVLFETAALPLFTPDAQFCTLGPAALAWLDLPGGAASVAALGLMGSALCGTAWIFGLRFAWFGPLPTLCPSTQAGRA